MPSDAGSVFSEVKIDIGDIKKKMSALSGLFNGVAVSAANFTKTAKGGLNATTIAANGLKAVVMYGLYKAFKALYQAIREAVRISMEYNQELANTQSVARAVTSELHELDAAARRAGETTRFTATEAASALYYLASAGFDAAESIDALDGVLALAQATASDMEVTAEEIAVVISQFSLEASEASRVANTFAAAITNSQATMDKLIFGFQTAGPVAAGLGVSLEETTAALQLLFNAGYRGQRAGRAFRNILGDLGYESSATSKKLKALGLNFEDFSTLSNDLVDVFGYLNEAGIDTSEVFAAFGKVASGQAEILVRAGAPAWEEMTEAVTDTNRAYEAAFIQNDTLEGDLFRLRSASEAFGITIGNTLNPVLRKFVRWMYEAVRNANNMIKIMTGQADTADRVSDRIRLLKEDLIGYSIAVNDVEQGTKGLTAAEQEQLELEVEQRYVYLEKSVSNLSKAYNNLTQDTKDSYKEMNEAKEALDNYIVSMNKKYDIDLSGLTDEETINAFKEALEEGIELEGFLATLQDYKDAINDANVSSVKEAETLSLLADMYTDNIEVISPLLKAYPDLHDAVTNYVIANRTLRNSQAANNEETEETTNLTDEQKKSLAELIGFTDKYTQSLKNAKLQQQEQEVSELVDKGEIEAANELRRKMFAQEVRMLEAALQEELEKRTEQVNREVEGAETRANRIQGLEMLMNDQLAAGKEALRMKYKQSEDAYAADHLSNLADIESAETNLNDRREDFQQDYIDKLSDEINARKRNEASVQEELGNIEEAFEIREALLDDWLKNEEQALEESYQAEKEKIEDSVLSEEQKAKQLTDLNDTYFDNAERLSSQYTIKYGNLVDERTEAEEKALKKIKDKRKEFFDELVNQLDIVVNAATDVMNYMSDANEAKVNKEIEDIEYAHKVAMNILEEEVEAEELKYEQDKQRRDYAYEDAKRQREEEWEDKKRLLSEELAAKKEAALIEAGLVVDTKQESLEKNLEKAKMAADEEAVIEAENALERYAIEKEYEEKSDQLQERLRKEELERQEEEREAERIRQEEEAKAQREFDEAQKEKKEKAEAEHQHKINQIEYESKLASWKMDKAVMAAQIALAGARALASTAWPLNLIALAATLASGAAQVSAHKAAKPEPPKPPVYYTGGIVQGSQEGTNIIAGDRGRTEAIMNPDQMANLLMAIGNGQVSPNEENMQVTFVMKDSNNKEQSKYTVDLINKGQYLIDPRRGIRKV